jgi:hypothetical protein
MPARDLKATRYSAAYRKRLDKGWEDFVEWLAKSNELVGARTFEKNPPLACNLLSKYVQHLYEKDPAKSTADARHTLLAAQKRFESLKGKLGPAWEVVESWRQESPGSLRNPIFLPAVLAMAVVGRMLAEVNEGPGGYFWMSFSILLEAAFFGLMRPVEFLTLLRSGVSLPGHMLGNAARYAICTIHNPKNRRQLGRTQFAVVRSVNSSEWLRWLCQDLDDSERLWPGTAKLFRKMFRQVCEILGMCASNFVPASLRAGGATYMFMYNVDPSRIKYYGRWSSERSLGHYLQESLTHQLAHTLPVVSQKLISLVLGEGKDLLVPPCVTCASLYPRPASGGSLVSKLARAAAVPAPRLNEVRTGAWKALYPEP